MLTSKTCPQHPFIEPTDRVSLKTVGALLACSSANPNAPSPALLPHQI